MKRGLKKNKLQFLPLGGSGEIGMNLNLYCYNDKWLMVDLGVTFGDRYGIEIITPDIEFIHERKDKLAGLVVTHAHEDHIGALPYLWPYLRCPVYLTPFSAGVLQRKLEELPWSSQVPIRVMEPNSHFKVDEFDLRFVQLTHSIPEAQAVLLKAGDKKIFHTGDWKIDHDPITGPKFDEDELRKIGKEGVDVLVCDSTNVFESGSTGSESHVEKELTAEIDRHKGKRVVVTCFASNIARLQTLFNAAKQTGRKVMLAGRSMDRMVEVAQSCGYLMDAPEVVSLDRFSKVARGKVLLVTTGSQGEARSGLARIANLSHPRVILDSDDVVIFSSRTIPGNEKNISLMKNQLVLQGVKVVSSRNDDLHVSGHPSQDELKKMYQMLNPCALIPVHGEARHLHQHAEFAQRQGIKSACVPMNGSLIDLNDADGPVIIDQIPVGRFAYDSNRMVPIECESILQRKRMSFNGAVSISLVLDKGYNLQNEPIIKSLGILEQDEISKVNKQVMRQVDLVLSDEWLNTDDLTEAIRLAVRRVFREIFDKKPTVMVHLHIV